jgi:hypothetical protein
VSPRSRAWTQSTQPAIAVSDRTGQLYPVTATDGCAAGLQAVDSISEGPAIRAARTGRYTFAYPRGADFRRPAASAIEEYDLRMSKRHRDKKDENAPVDDGGESGVTPERPAWQTGHLPHIPRDPSEEDFITGWFHERLLDGLFEARADDEDHSEHGAGQPPRSAERWATGSPRRSRHSTASDDLPDYEAERENPPERESL